MIAWAVPRLRSPARRPLVVHRARLGRLLGLGPGRERGADAVAFGHRIPALDHGPGEARDAEGLERLPGAAAAPSRWPAGTFLVRSGVLQSIHAFGNNTVGPYLLALIAVVMVGSAALIVSRLDDLRSEKRIDSLISRESVFLLQPATGGADRGDLLGHLLPADLGAFYRQQGLPRAPWFDRYTSAGDPCWSSGIGPLLAWRRVSWDLRSGSSSTGDLRRRGRRRALSRPTDTPQAMGVRPFRVRARPSRWPGRAGVLAGSGGAPLDLRRSRPGALLAVVPRNRRRYGGYIVHIGIAVVLIGIAASSSFQHSQDVLLSPGQHAKIDGYTVRYVKPVESVTAAKISFGAVLDVTKGGNHVTTVTTTRSYYPSTDPTQGIVGRFFDSVNSDSQVGLDAGLRRDISDGDQRRSDAAQFTDQPRQHAVRRLRPPGHDQGREAPAGAESAAHERFLASMNASSRSSPRLARSS